LLFRLRVGRGVGMGRVLHRVFLFALKFTSQLRTARTEDPAKVRVRGGGVTSKEIDRTWMCDSMETRDSAPRVCPRSRETRRTVLCQEYGPQVTRKSP